MKSRFFFSVACVVTVAIAWMPWIHHRITRLGLENAVETVFSIVQEFEQKPETLETDPHHHFREDNAPVAWQNITYRYPTHFFANLNSWENDNFPQVITGVLSANSATKYRRKRDIIRNTWAYKRNDIIFLVAGEWDAVRDEFEEYGDIFWVDREEAYHKITWKVQTFFNAVNKHVQRFGHVLKTDDDSYVNIGDVSRASRTEYNDTDYIGLCMSGMGIRKELLEEYPTYASGSGYLLSRHLIECFTEFVPTSLSIATEDALSGILASACNAECTTSSMINPWRGDTDLLHTQKDFWIQHYVYNEDEMAYLHWMACNSKNNTEETSCGTGSKMVDHIAVPIFCGGHRSESCGQCPQGHAEKWCHGDCRWCEYGVKEGINSTFASTAVRAELDQCVSKQQTCKEAKDAEVVKEDEVSKESEASGEDEGAKEDEATKEEDVSSVHDATEENGVSTEDEVSEESEVTEDDAGAKEDEATREEDVSSVHDATEENDVSTEDEAAKEDEASEEKEVGEVDTGAKEDEAPKEAGGTKEGQEGMESVSCGGHRADSCEKCPQDHGEKWCHGDCHWCDDGQTDKNDSNYNAQCLPALQQCEAK